MKVKIKSFLELLKLGFIYRESKDHIIVKSKNNSWRAFPADIFDRDIIVDDSKYYLSQEEYEEFKDLFDIQ